MKKTGLSVILIVIIFSNFCLAQYTKKTLIAHRGASAYAPENTLEAYKLAL